MAEKSKMKYLKSCKSCMANKGVKRISPAEPIYLGKYWRIEHVYPCKIKGWLVLLTNRHVDALHNLTKAEMQEFNRIFPKIPKALHNLLKNEKEYVLQLAEGKGFHHVHFHIVAKPKNLPKKYIGPNVTGLMTNKGSISRDETISFCKLLKNELNRLK
jgi:diadenosine tetraphosphate (Ap4A) HIT family hydrolase